MRTYLSHALLAVFAVSLVPTATAMAKEQKKSEDLEAVTCRYETVVGSKIPTKVCMSNFEWQDRRRAQEENRQSSRNRNSGCEGFPC